MQEEHYFITMHYFWKNCNLKCFFENVKGLLTHDHGKTYNTMLDIFESAGYEIQKKVLNA